MYTVHCTVDHSCHQTPTEQWSLCLHSSSWDCIALGITVGSAVLLFLYLTVTVRCNFIYITFIVQPPLYIPTVGCGIFTYNAILTVTVRYKRGIQEGTPQIYSHPFGIQQRRLGTCLGPPTVRFTDSLKILTRKIGSYFAANPSIGGVAVLKLKITLF